MLDEGPGQRRAAEEERLAASGPLAEAERELQKLDTEARRVDFFRIGDDLAVASHSRAVL